MPTTVYFENKTNAVPYVNELLFLLKQDSVLTITIRPEKSGGCFVTSVTEESSVDIETLHSSKQPTNT
jgi:hypothetical protein